MHRLNDLGAVVTQAVRGTSDEGFEAEWREITLVTIDGDLINRIELFDEADIDAALAKFDELSRPTPRLENAASQVGERVQALFMARNWDAIAEILDEDISVDDRRRVVSAPLLRGRNVEIANMRALAEIGATKVSSAVIATRGGRLALVRSRFSGRDQRPEAFHTDLLDIVEINPNSRLAAHVVFDPDDIDAAIEELDARYLAGEAAEHSRTWSVIAKNYAGLNRQEVPAMTSDWVNVDHRRVTTIAPGELIANLRAAWDLTPQASFYIETVHRLTDLGAVVTDAMSGTSQEGFEAEWRFVDLMTFEGDLMNRSELFDEADLDAALARFDELSRKSR